MTVPEINIQLALIRAQLKIQAEQLATQKDLLASQAKLIATQKDLLVSQAEQSATQAELIAKQEALIKYYESQILLLKRRQFGVSSEKTDVDYRQLTLFGDASKVPPPKPATEEITYKRKKRIGKREEDLSGLPVERVDYELPEDKRICPECGELLRDIGVDVRRELKLIPAKVVVLEHAAHTYACQHCQKNADMTPIVKAESPKPLISGSLASPSLVAHIILQKYTNGMPLYRIEKGFQYDGVVVTRQNMTNWVIKCAELYLESIYSLLKSHLLKEYVLHSDGTVVQVLREKGRAAQTKSCEWVYRTSAASKRKIVLYDYQETKGQEHPQAFLKAFKGYLHTDGAPAYHNLPEGITIVGCWAHLHRYWENLLKTLPKDSRKGSDAERGVAYINRLFALEREFKNLSPDERYQKRLEKSKPVADAFFEWVSRLGALPKSPLGKPVTYTLSQRVFLENVFLDGRLEFSNNRCERSVKPFVMGRKAWLFSCSPEGARASSVLYSIIETAKENGLHSFHYVKFLLETLPNATCSGIEALLPWSDSLPEYCFVPCK